MIVTRVSLKLFPPGKKRVRAVGSFVIDKCFQIEHIHIVERDDGTLIVAMPSKYEGERYHDIAHPITSSFRAVIDNAVLEEYLRLKQKALTGGAMSDTVQP